MNSKWIIKGYSGFVVNQKQYAYYKKEAIEAASEYMKKSDKVEIIRLQP